MTAKKPLDIFFGRNISKNLKTYEKSKQDNIDRMKQKQELDLQNHNKPVKQFKIIRQDKKFLSREIKDY